MKRLLARICRIRSEYREIGSGTLLHDNTLVYRSRLATEFLVKNRFHPLNHFLLCNHVLFTRWRRATTICYLTAFGDKRNVTRIDWSHWEGDDWCPKDLFNNGHGEVVWQFVEDCKLVQMYIGFLFFFSVYYKVRFILEWRVYFILFFDKS